MQMWIEVRIEIDLKEVEYLNLLMVGACNVLLWTQNCPPPPSKTGQKFLEPERVSPFQKCLLCLELVR